MTDNKDVRIYDAIRSIAKKICENGETYLRADLAFELKQFGIEADSVDISKLVLGAYRYFNNDKDIEKAFVTNDGRNALINEYQMTDFLDNDKPEEAMAIATKELAKTSNTLADLKKEIELSASEQAMIASSNLMDKVTGTSGIKAVRSQASSLFGQYSKMVSTYHEGKDTVQKNIKDFTTLRAEIGATYQEFAAQLIDIYGDSIKAVAPNLFDFDQIQFLDVDSMLKRTELDYNKIVDKCPKLIGEITDAFQKSLRMSITAFKAVKGDNMSFGLTMAGIEMAKHYMHAAEQTNELRSELVAFKTSVKRDETLIKADLGRLLVIYKSLNDVFIPKANTYLRYAAKLMSSDINAITNSLYQNTDIQPLEKKRNELIREIKALDDEINDHLQNIALYNNLVSDLKEILNSKAASYNDAKAKEPSKPFFLTNVVTFGHANKVYYRDYTEWDTICRPLIREYDCNRTDLALDQKELDRHNSELKERQTERLQLQQNLDVVNKEIRSKVKASDEVQMKMLPYLRTIIAMLRLGREIMESKLDNKLIGTVSISDPQNVEELPNDIEDNLTLFASTLADNIHIDHDEAQSLLKSIDERYKSNKKQRKCSDEELSQMANTSEEAIHQGYVLLDSALHLKALQLNGKLMDAAYNKEFEKIASNFRKQINDIDNKSAFIREVMRRTNLADNDEERKQALLLLSELGGQSLSEQDFKDFINGNKQIEL